MSLERKGKPKPPRSASHNFNLTKAIRETFINGRVGVNTGKCFSKETREKISSSRKGIKLSQEHKDAVRRAHIGSKRSQSTKDKMSLNHPRRKLSDSQIKLILTENNKPLKYVSKKYNVSMSTISRIRIGKRGYLKLINNGL